MSGITKWRRTLTEIRFAAAAFCAPAVRTSREKFLHLLREGFTQKELDRYICTYTNPGEVRRRHRAALKAMVALLDYIDTVAGDPATIAHLLPPAHQAALAHLEHGSIERRNLPVDTEPTHVNLPTP